MLLFEMLQGVLLRFSCADGVSIDFFGEYHFSPLGPIFLQVELRKKHFP